MSGHDDLGFDADLGPARDILKQTIGALVDGATPRDVPSAPEVNLGFLRRRVRTWRVAKVGAAGLTSALVVGVFAFSTAQATTWNRSEPLPGRPTVHATDTGPLPSEVPTTRLSQAPTPAASPSPSPSKVPETTESGPVAVDPAPEVSTPSATDEPDDVITAPFDDGYRPWGDDRPAWCGMPDADLVSTSPSVSIEIVGDLSYARGEGGTVPIRLTGQMPGYSEPGGGGDTESIGNGALLIWSQGGRVVDLGTFWREASYEIPPTLNDAGVWTGAASASSFSTCIEADEIDGAPYGYDNVRAAGTYQVRAAQIHTVEAAGAGDSEEYLVISAPVTVTVP